MREARCELGRCWKRQEGQQKAAVLPEGWGESLASRERRYQKGERKKTGKTAEEKENGFGGRGKADNDNAAAECDAGV